MIAKPDPKRPYLFQVSFPYRPKLVEAVAALQGSIWQPGASCWTVPVEWADKLEALGFGVIRPKYPSVDPSLIRGNREYQIESVQKAMQSPGGFLCAYEMKLGKSAPALDIARLKNAKRVLIVCPAASRPAWEDEIAKWWPEMQPHTYKLLKAPKLLGKAATSEWLNHVAADTRVTLTSYQQVGQLPPMYPDVIIFDEIQALGRYTSRQSKACRKLREANPTAYVVGLSGTPQANETSSWFNPLDIIWPGRWHYFHTERNSERSFAGRYCEPVFNGYGFDFNSIDEKYGTEEQKAALAEFKWRLGILSHRVTKLDVQHLLPPLSTDSRRRDEDFDLRSLVEAEIGSSIPATALLFASHESWTAAYDQLRGINAEVAILSGAETAEQRTETLKKLKEAPRRVAICSIAACALTIDLSAFPNVHFMEITDKPTQMSQVIGRFQTPEGTNKINMTFWYTKDSYEKTLRLERKAASLAAVMAAGSSETQMQEAFAKQSRFTKQEWQDAIADITGFVL